MARIHEGAWYDPDKGGEPGALCKYGQPNVLTIDIGTSQLAQATSAHTTLVEIEKYNGAVEQVTAFNGPVEMVAKAPDMFPRRRWNHDHADSTTDCLRCRPGWRSRFSCELDDEQLTQIASAQMAEWFSLLKLNRRWLRR